MCSKIFSTRSITCMYEQIIKLATVVLESLLFILLNTAYISFNCNFFTAIRQLVRYLLDFVSKVEFN